MVWLRSNVLAICNIKSPGNCDYNKLSDVSTYHEPRMDLGMGMGKERGYLVDAGS